MNLYNPPHFRSTDRAALHAALAAQPFATLVSNGPDGPLVTHLPLLLEPGQDGQPDRLIGHIARANPHGRDADPAMPGIAIFHGPDTYVSPGWYPSKAAHGKVVPTWNYAVIHATGMLTFHEDPAWLNAAVAGLTDRQEAGRTAPWAVSDAPESFIAGQLKGIIGVEMHITRLEGKFKLSQNRSAADREGVIAGLAGEAAPGSAGVRRLMTDPERS